VVREAVMTLGRRPVLRRVRVWIAGAHAESGADRLRATDRAHGPRFRRLREVRDVHRAHAQLAVSEARRVDARYVAEEGEDPRLVEDHPVLHAITQGFDARLGVRREVLDDVSVAPAALVLQRLGE